MGRLECLQQSVEARTGVGVVEGGAWRRVWLMIVWLVMAGLWLLCYWAGAVQEMVRPAPVVP